MRQGLMLIMVFWLFYGCASNETTEEKTEPSHLPSGDDLRAYQHGVDFLKRPEGNYFLVWASSGLPPQGEDVTGAWSHDVYYSMVNTPSPNIKPVVIIAQERAQEPVSAAITQSGNIMLTMEDTYQDEEVFAQTYGVYNAAMEPIKAYRNVVAYGGHSGHVAAVGERFVVFYSDGWIDGGGVDELGSGDDVLLKAYDANGELLHVKEVAVGDATRDWWPLLAGSKHHALLLWQQFEAGKESAKLLYSVYDPSANRWLKHSIVLARGVQYYTYDVQYLETLNSFLVCGRYDTGSGFAFVLSAEGTIISQNKALPPLVREAQPAIRALDEESVKVVYPTAPNGAMVLLIRRSEIRLEKEISVDDRWSYSGTDGIFTSKNQVYFVTLSPEGLQEVYISVE